MRQPETSTVVQQLFDNYRLENLDVAYTIQDFQKDYIREHLNVLLPDEALNRYSMDDRLKGLSPTDIANHLAPEDVKKLLEELKKH